MATKLKDDFAAVVAWAEKRVKGLTKEEALLILVQRLMKKGWSRAAARHRANLMLGGGLLGT